MVDSEHLAEQKSINTMARPRLTLNIINSGVKSSGSHYTIFDHIMSRLAMTGTACLTFGPMKRNRTLVLVHQSYASRVMEVHFASRVLQTFWERTEGIRRIAPIEVEDTTPEQKAVKPFSAAKPH